jgi:hypothetical protein
MISASVIPVQVQGLVPHRDATEPCRQPALRQRPGLHRRLARMVLAAAVLVGCAHDPDRLPELDRRFYENLPTGTDQQEFLRVKPSERQAFLEDKGLWAKWEALPEAERTAAGHGEVELGFHEFALYMAWGPPADTQDRDSNGRPLQLLTFIRCSSGPKRGRYVRSNLDCDGTSSETQVSINEGLVTEITYPN